jgi:hypothetical protein
MIGPVDAGTLTPAQRAAVLYEEVRGSALSQLWQTVLGTDGGVRAAQPITADPAFSLTDLMSLMDHGGVAPAPPAPAQRPAPPAAPPSGAPTDAQAARLADLGPNHRLRTALCEAATRTGVPAPTLAAIINAEAAKDRDGCWNTHSRNPRSSAAGLGQFLSGTWQSLAETKGSWLNAVARARGWIGADGRVLASARSALLALRYDPGAAINALADYTRQNLDGLQHRGFAVGGSVETVTKLAYAAHHLGLADACRFLRGGLSDAHARKLLRAQIGDANANRRIASAGAAGQAHRAWMLGHIGRTLRLDQFVG